MRNAKWEFEVPVTYVKLRFFISHFAFLRVDFLSCSRPNTERGENHETLENRSRQIVAVFLADLSGTVSPSCVFGQTHCRCFSCVPCRETCVKKIRNLKFGLQFSNFAFRISFFSFRTGFPDRWRFRESHSRRQNVRTQFEWPSAREECVSKTQSVSDTARRAPQ